MDEGTATRLRKCDILMIMFARAALIGDGSDASDILAAVYGDFGTLRDATALQAYLNGNCDSSVVTGSAAGVYAQVQGLAPGRFSAEGGVTACRDKGGMYERVQTCASLALLASCHVACITATPVALSVCEILCTTSKEILKIGWC